MKEFRKPILGFIMALMAVMAIGAQDLPNPSSFESWVLYPVKCIPEALFAPLFFPLAICYSGCAFSEHLLGCSGITPVFFEQATAALLRAGIIGGVFWSPWIAREIFPRSHRAHWGR